MFASGGKWPSRELPVKTLQCAGPLHRAMDVTQQREMSPQRNVGNESRGGQRMREKRGWGFSYCCDTQTWVTGRWNGSVDTNLPKSRSNCTICGRVQTKNNWELTMCVLSLPYYTLFDNTSYLLSCLCAAVEIRVNADRAAPDISISTHLWFVQQLK